jgi:hypothetical protein
MFTINIYVTMMKASMRNDCRPTRAASRETLVWSSRPHDGDIVVSFYFLWASFVEQRLGQRLVEEMSSHAWLRGAKLSHVCSAGATHNRSSMVASTSRLVRANADLYPEDGPAVGGGDSFRSESMKRLWRVCYTGRVLLFHHRVTERCP